MTDGYNFKDSHAYLVHLLRVLAGQGPTEPSAVYEEVADRAGLTQEQRQVVTPSRQRSPVYRNRIQFARQSLVDAKLVVGSSESGWHRGRWETTAEGDRLGQSDMDDAQLQQILMERASVGARERTLARKASRVLAGLDSEDSRSDIEAPDPSQQMHSHQGASAEIAAHVEAENATVMTTMLDHLRSMDEFAFEHLVGEVLVAALRADSVTITQRSRDGGIDGVLHFDALGMQTAVFEAKRYGEGNVVSRPQLDAFATAARRCRAPYAIFVTSSHFSPEAIEAAQDEAVRLIDGVAFVELMAEHGIGLRAKKSFVLYEVDPAWVVDDADL